MKKSLVSLAMGTFGLGIAEFVMMGILPDIASSLNVSIPTAGHLISAYAMGVCVGAPLIVLIARKRPLKQILYGLVALIIIGNIGASLSPSFFWLFTMRFVSGLPHGAFFGVGSIVAEKVADKGKAAAAVALMVSGMTVANMLGVPLGTYVSGLLSWRLTFMIVGAWGAVVMFFIGRWVPVLPPMPDTGIKGQFRFLLTPAPWFIIMATMLGNGGIFCYYSYVNPIMTHVAGFSESIMPTVMVLAGCGMVLGNLTGGYLSDRYTPERIAAVTQAVACAALVAVFFLAAYRIAAVALMLVCTASLFALSAPQQLLILQNSRGGEMMGAACAQIAFNMGNALGAYCGGLPIESGLGYNYAALPGIAFTFCGFLVLLRFCKLYGRKRAS